MDEELSKEVKMLGFPIKHKHKLCCLRQELIDSFIDSRYMMFIKYAAHHLQQLNVRKNDAKIINNPQIEENKTENVTETIKDTKEVDKENKSDNKKEDGTNGIEEEEAKKIVESITDGNKIECKEVILFSITFHILLLFINVYLY